MTEPKTAVGAAKQTAVVTWRGREVAFTGQDVKSLICPKATDQETIVFLRNCESLQLNPFAGECYLIKYSDTDKAAFVIDIDSYHKAAEQNEQYDGFEAGIILAGPTGALEHREGAFLLDGERQYLAGGWAKVYRKDRSKPYYVAVHKVECIRYTREGKPTTMWAEAKQPWMLRKVALKRALVEAFASLFAGTMATAEVGGGVEAEYREIPEGTLPPPLVKGGKPNWKKFWAKVESELHLTEEKARELLKVESIKKDLIDQGVTMEQIWTSLINALQDEQEREAYIGPDEETPEEALFAEPEVERPKRDPQSIKSLNHLFKACSEDFSIQPFEVVRELGYSKAADITKTPADCYIEIAAVRVGGEA